MHADFTLLGTSFFLPALTISPVFGRIIVLVPFSYLNVTNALGVCVWLVVAGLFVHRAHRLWQTVHRNRSAPVPAKPVPVVEPGVVTTDGRGI